MMRFLFFLSFSCFYAFPAVAQAPNKVLKSYSIGEDIRITVDQPMYRKPKETIVIFYALPNGNTTAQTMGRKMQAGDDWHFDIQHIAAQTVFIRQMVKNRNFVVVYLENSYKSWPQWKQKHPEFKNKIPQIVDSLAQAYGGDKYSICLNGHSGGGSFIFGYLAGVAEIPKKVKRISFIDSNYGFDSSYYPQLREWILDRRGTALNVFAYNDSVALYNGKPVVSATGGTWYRSFMMLGLFTDDLRFTQSVSDSIEMYKSTFDQVQFFFKPNPDRGIYHTQQVERNGFIHSILCGTKYDSRGYRYYGERAYSEFIE